MYGNRPSGKMRSIGLAFAFRPYPPAYGGYPYSVPRGSTGIRLEIWPVDSSVYLDGRFVGTGEEIAELGTLPVDAGDHVLEVVRPGYRPAGRAFEAFSGIEAEMEVRLRPEG